MALSSSLLGLMQKLPVFQDLSPTQLKQLFGICLQENYEKGASLCKTGGESDRMFILLSGEVAIFTPGNVLLAREKAITTIGEAGLLTGEPRAASVATETEVKALLIRRRSFFKLMQEDSTLATRLYRNMMVMLRRKLIAADRRIEELSQGQGK
jgi:CRP-like cAMP-binding protein